MIIGSILCAASTLHFYNIFSIMFSSTRKTHCVVDREAVKRLHTQKWIRSFYLSTNLISDAKCFANENEFER